MDQLDGSVFPAHAHATPEGADAMRSSLRKQLRRARNSFVEGNNPHAPITPPDTLLQFPLAREGKTPIITYQVYRYELL